MLHNDIYLTIHRPVACNLCLLNSRFVSSNQKPTCKMITQSYSVVSFGVINYFHREA